MAEREKTPDLGSSRTAWVRDLSFATLVYVVATACFAALPTIALYDETAFRVLYGWSIYAPRIVGRELILGVHQLLESVGVAEVLALTGSSGGGEMFGAFLVVNGAAFLCFAACLRQLLLRTLDEMKALVAFLVVVTVAAMSFYAVTPYDALGMFLIVGCLMLAVTDDYRKWYAVPVLLIGVLTRESPLLVVAALLPLSFVRPRLVRPSFALLLAGVGAVVYIGLRLAFPDSGIFQSMLLLSSLSRPGSVIGLVVLALLAVVWLTLLPLLGLRVCDLGDRARTAVLGFWIVASPYWVTSIIGGLWFESLRLVMPLLLGDLAVRIFLKMSRDAGDDADGQSDPPDVEAAGDALVRR